MWFFYFSLLSFTLLFQVKQSEDTDELELYSVYKLGSKKQNLNHLLNFHFTPRQQIQSSLKSNNRVSSTHFKFDKNQFLQANCQFIVNNNVENISSFNMLKDWAYIEQINVIMYEEAQCPICLYPPVACKITKCGHYYCW